MRRKISIPGTLAMPLFVFGVVVGFLIHIPFHANARGPSWQEYFYNGPAGSRPYFVYTPVNYRVGKAVPLFVMLHGCTQTSADFAAGTQMNQLADQHSFIVVYPQQTSNYNGFECWNWFDTSNQTRGSEEAAIIAGIVQVVERNTAQWRIDRHRIYVAGASAGGAMSVILGATYPDMFAAIGVDTGFEYQAATSVGSAAKAGRQGGPDPTQRGRIAYQAMGNYARVVPTIVFHGTSDIVNNSINGDQVVQQWMQTDRLASHGTYRANFNSPTSTRTAQVPNGHSYRLYRWNDRKGHELQEYWKVNGMGHAWSGGSDDSTYTDPQGPSASRAMYTFFMSHPMS